MTIYRERHARPHTGTRRGTAGAGKVRTRAAGTKKKAENGTRTAGTGTEAETGIKASGTAGADAAAQVKTATGKMRKKKPLRKLDCILLALAGFLLCFILGMVVLFCCFQAIPDTLVTCVLGGGVTELVCTTVIKILGDRTETRPDENEPARAGADAYWTGEDGAEPSESED